MRDDNSLMYEPRESVKLPALNSVSKGVKYNDLSFLTGRELNKLRKEPEPEENAEYQSAHANMTDIRKKYDNAQKERKAIDCKI